MLICLLILTQINHNINNNLILQFYEIFCVHCNTLVFLEIATIYCFTLWSHFDCNFCKSDMIELTDRCSEEH